jgi:hypothetical protein
VSQGTGTHPRAWEGVIFVVVRSATDGFWVSRNWLVAAKVRFFDPLFYRHLMLTLSLAFIATLLFDPSMSALPIIPKQNSVSVGLFTH